MIKHRLDLIYLQYLHSIVFRGAFPGNFVFLSFYVTLSSKTYVEKNHCRNKFCIL